MIIWDWVEAVSINKQLSAQPLLPSTTSAYGKIAIVDNACPIVQRTFTANAVTAAQVSTVLGYAKSRNACLKIKTSLGTWYTGRLISAQAAQTKGADFWQMTIVQQDIDDEVTGTTQVVYDLGQDIYTTSTPADDDDGGDPIPDDDDDGGDPIPDDDDDGGDPIPDDDDDGGDPIPDDDDDGGDPIPDDDGESEDD